VTNDESDLNASVWIVANRAGRLWATSTIFSSAHFGFRWLSVFATGRRLQCFWLVDIVFFHQVFIDAVTGDSLNVIQQLCTLYSSRKRAGKARLGAMSASPYFISYSISCALAQGELFHTCTCKYRGAPYYNFAPHKLQYVLAPPQSLWCSFWPVVLWWWCSSTLCTLYIFQSFFFSLLVSILFYSYSIRVCVRVCVPIHTCIYLSF